MRNFPTRVRQWMDGETWQNAIMTSSSIECGRYKRRSWSLRASGIWINVMAKVNKIIPDSAWCWKCYEEQVSPLPPPSTVPLSYRADCFFLLRPQHSACLLVPQIFAHVFARLEMSSALYLMHSHPHFHNSFIKLGIYKLQISAQMSKYLKIFLNLSQFFNSQKSEPEFVVEIFIWFL